MSDFLKSIGLIKIKNVKPYNYDSSKYDVQSSLSKIKAHKDFLKSAIEEENNRLIAIESKTNQLVSQTSVVFSLLSLTIPILIDKSEDANVYLRVSLIILVLIAFAFYFLAIFNALKNFNVKNFKYFVAGPANVIDLKDKSEEDFEAELVRDYLDSINNNIAVNNTKATNLLHSNNAFKIGNVFTVIIILLISVMVLFIKNEKEELEIKNPQKVIIRNFKNEVLDTIIIHDTIIIKVTDTIKKVDTVYIRVKPK